ncbi:MFS transporter [Rhodococcoides fascians A21d2]|uniref:MFS transporter n=1 Tax=Rhodococcoides fascians TaxID=1828 RepID=UPI00055CEECE|nr:MFS transporter [Rhodococcus fascians]QIH98898.1 MFS transporter [Rhodococcus fascians A21d2]
MSSPLPKLLVLAAAAFIYVTAETLPVGLLPEISGDLGVSEAAVGLLLTFYAYGVAVMTMPLIRFVREWPRRRVVVITVAALALSQLLSAVSVGYPMLVISRMLCAATHGIFWAVVAPVAASLALPGKQGKAIATVYAGTSLALVAGNPLTAALGQWLGWRTAATILGIVAAAIAVALYFVLPPLPVSRTVSDKKTTPRVLDGTLAILCGVTFLAVLGHFAAYTYFALIVDRAIGSAGTTLTLMLMLYGLFGVVGIWVIGRTYDRWPRHSTIAALGAVAVAVAILWCTLSGAPGSFAVFAVVAIALWGLAFTTLPVCIQSAVVRAAPGDADKASAIYVVAFQLAIATGALVGGVVVDVSGIVAVTAAATVLVAGALAVVLLARNTFPRTDAQEPVRAAAR